MLGKSISMTAHALGMVAVLGCAVMAQRMAVTATAVARQDPPSTLGGDDRAAPALPAGIALATK